MEIQVTRYLAQKIGFEAFKPLGIPDQSSWGWQPKAKVEIDLKEFKDDRITKFLAHLEPLKSMRAVANLIRDIETWKAALSGDVESKTIRSIRSFDAVLTAYMQNVPGHRVYKKHRGKWLAHYMDNIRYHPPHRDSWSYTPAHVTCELRWEDETTDHHEQKTWWEDDVHGNTVVEALLKLRLYPETDELRAAYEKTQARYRKVFAKIGRQYVLNGQATFESSGGGWWQRHVRGNVYVGARVVIDVVKEGADDEEEEDDEDDVDEDTSNGPVAHQSTFWKQKLTDPETDEEGETIGEHFEMPVHPYLKVFHLKKHLRLRCHIDDLTRYKYDTKMINKLVIDDVRKALVKVLIAHRDSGYQDILEGKGGGAIVLLHGAPGTGKTLTAEVFAESEKRALYSVQCSQLGTSPEELEKELLKVLARAERWKAVLLLDEADVYVHKRGNDIIQNALVGVFLRVLEYQNAVMFMTTNRHDDIDDAVISRCTAQLAYQRPTKAEAKKIWRVLTETAGVEMSDEDIAAVVKEDRELSGRDVKNLIKLAMLVKPGEPLTAETIEFAKQFKT